MRRYRKYPCLIGNNPPEFQTKTLPHRLHGRSERRRGAVAKVGIKDVDFKKVRRIRRHVNGLFMHSDRDTAKSSIELGTDRGSTMLKEKC